MSSPRSETSPTSDVGAIGTALSFMASCIKSGEGWSPVAERIAQRAHDALSRLSAPAALERAIAETINVEAAPGERTALALAVGRIDEAVKAKKPIGDLSPTELLMLREAGLALMMQLRACAVMNVIEDRR